MANRNQRYVRIADGEGIELQWKKGKSNVVKIACVDCGSTHNIAVAVEENGNLGIAIERNKQATAAARRGKKLLLLPDAQPEASGIRASGMKAA